METVMNSNEIDTNFIEKIKKIYINKKVKITIEEVTPLEQLSGKEKWKLMLEMRKKYPPKVISKDIDLSALANEVNL